MFTDYNGANLLYRHFLERSYFLESFLHFVQTISYTVSISIYIIDQY